MLDVGSNTHPLAPATHHRLLVAPQQEDELRAQPPQAAEPAAELAVAPEQLAHAGHFVSLQVGERPPAGAAAGQHVIRPVLAPRPAHAVGLAARAIPREERAPPLLALPQELAHEGAPLPPPGPHLPAAR